MKIQFKGETINWFTPQFLYAGKVSGGWSCGIVTLPTKEKAQRCMHLSWQEVGQEMGGN
tara:strand:+ start:220 stop:396 length:177 start_codon:yes stop_codon:yes gene_type:complete